MRSDRGVAAELEEGRTRTLLEALNCESAAPSAMARRLGDGLRARDAPRHLVNECYRVSFYTGDEWKRLSGARCIAYFAAPSGQSARQVAPLLPDLRSPSPGVSRRTRSRAGDRRLSWRRSGAARHYLGGEATSWGRHRRGGGSCRRGRVRGRDRRPGGRGVPRPRGRATWAVRHRHRRWRPLHAAADHVGRGALPSLSDGGVYIVEDCHTSYWSEFRTLATGSERSSNGSRSGSTTSMPITTRPSGAAPPVAHPAGRCPRLRQHRRSGQSVSLGALQ